MINILICEDEPVICKDNKRYIEELSKKFKVEVDIYAIRDGKDIPHKYFDIAFLDIDMGEDNGIVIAKKILKINKAAPIIFITSHGEYALDACKLQCFGYILKPIDVSVLEQLYAKAIIQVKSIKNRSFDDQLSICMERKQFLIKQCDIIYIERVQRKINIVTMAKIYSVNESLNTITQKLENYFLQVSQGTIVNAREIQSLEGNVIYMKTGHKFKIGRAFKSAKNYYYNLAK